MHIERTRRAVGAAAGVPIPGAPLSPVGLTVLDLGWPLGLVLGSGSWLAGHLRTEWVVLTTRASVPGLRRLESALGQLATPRPQPGQTQTECSHGEAEVLPALVLAAVLGPRRSRWPRAVTASAGAYTRALDAAGRLVLVPDDPVLRVRGVDSAPLPDALVDAAARLLDATSIFPPTNGSLS